MGNIFTILTNWQKKNAVNNWILVLKNRFCQANYYLKIIVFQNLEIVFKVSNKPVKILFNLKLNIM